MRRVAAILLLSAAAVAILVSGTAAGGDEGTYEVRAVFDNASFLVPGEDVRVAGANVGTVAEIDVAGPEEAVREDGAPAPGKAIVVLRIDDPAFQDFREDASCLIRPQSLIGEKFVECEPTRPRAPGSEPPPELEPIAEGEPGAGQRLLPLEQNGKAVDLDLVNDIMEEPYPDRFRLILNDLGAGFAARGDELAEIVERSNPALRETNDVLAILARQNRALASLASDSDAILGALARERDRVASFVNQATVVGEATAERRADLEESFARFPGFLRELRATMVELRAFSDEATPVFADLRAAAPSLTRVNTLLEPFSNAGTGALTTLGEASAASAGPLVASDPVIRQLRGLAKSSGPAARDLARFLATLRKTDGFENLLETIFGLGGSVNAFDGNGHFLRAVIPLNNCFDYTSILQAGCSAKFVHTEDATAAARAQQTRLQRMLGRLDRKRARGDRGEEPGAAQPPVAPPDASAGPAGPEARIEPRAEGEAPPLEPQPEAGPDAAPAPRGAAAEPRANPRAMRDLLDFLIGRRAGGGGRR